MNKNYNLNEIKKLSGLIVDKLWEENFNEIPLEVNLAIIEAKWQMQDLPLAIQDLNLALNAFNELNFTIKEMKKVAKKASQTIDKNKQEELQKEFNNLATIIAQQIGRANYQGPKLKVNEQIKAQAAAHIIAYLEPLLAQSSQKLNQQKDLIINAFIETVNFLEIINTCYPKTAAKKQLPQLIKKLKENNNLEQINKAHRATIMIH